MSVPPAWASRAAMSATAIAAAPGSRLYSESPLMMPSMPIPIAPPITSSPRHTSMLCAQPCSCSLSRLSSSVSVSQRGSRSARHSSATRSNLASAVVVSSPRRSCLRRLRPTCTSSTPSTGRWSGDHHATQYGSSSPTSPMVPSATSSSYRISFSVR
jgi:hypothetical protein